MNSALSCGPGWGPGVEEFCNEGAGRLGVGTTVATGGVMETTLWEANISGKDGAARLAGSSLFTGGFGGSTQVFISSAGRPRPWASTITWVGADTCTELLNASSLWTSGFTSGIGDTIEGFKSRSFSIIGDTRSAKVGPVGVIGVLAGVAPGSPDECRGWYWLCFTRASWTARSRRYVCRRAVSSCSRSRFNAFGTVWLAL